MKYAGANEPRVASEAAEHPASDAASGRHGTRGGEAGSRPFALFKLRITSLSSHRDKQRFRIRVSPVDTSLLLREPVREESPS